ncbi:MAG: hypothetical protein NT018_10060 [Armatimonadetes bacterium]|nr:hypothetical protein [Armatimonadota bacterium]
MARHQNSADEPRSELPLWAERYARNRTLHIVLWIVGLQIVIMALCGLTLLLTESHNPLMVILSIVINGSIGAAMLWMIVTGRVSRAFQSFTERLYRQEGNAVPTHPSQRASHGRLTGYAIMVSMGAGPWLLMFVYLHVLKVSPAYTQPAMAAVIVPALIVLILVGPGNPKWLGLLLPVLYAMHAVLALAGARIPVFGVSYLDVFVPLFVYAMLTVIAMHIYSRYALLRLRIAALETAAQFTEADEKGEDNGDA